MKSPNVHLLWTIAVLVAVRRLSNLPDEIKSMRGELSDRMDKINVQTSAPTTHTGRSEADGTYLSQKPFGLVFSLYIMALSFKLTAAIELEKMFPDDDDDAFLNYINGVITAFKFYNTCGVKVDGLARVYLVTTMGEFDQNAIISEFKATVFPEEDLKRFAAAVDSFFARDELPEDKGEPA